jgi:hypothetical protein
MVDGARPRRGIFHARLCPVESHLFRAEYSGEMNPENPDEREAIDFYVGTDTAGVRRWVEEMAKGLGHPEVVWEQGDTE